MATGTATDAETSSAKNSIVRDKYRTLLHDDGDEEANIHWRHGGPPTYDDVNLLFEQGRTKVLTPPPLPRPRRHSPSISLSHTHTYTTEKLHIIFYSNCFIFAGMA